MLRIFARSSALDLNSILTLRQCLTSQGTRKEHNEGYDRFLFVHLTFSFHILILAWMLNF